MHPTLQAILSLKLDRSWDVFVLTPRHTHNELVLSPPINVTDGSNDLCWIKGHDPFNQNSNRSNQEKWHGPPQKVDPFFQNFSSWTEPIHWVLDRNFPKFWLNGSRPKTGRSQLSSVHWLAVKTKSELTPK